MTTQKRDVVGEHANFGSKVYAPVARDGRLPVKNQVVDYGIPLISNYQGLSALAANLPTNTFELAVKAPQKIIPKSCQGRKGQKVVADLEYVEKMLEDKHVKKAVVVENVYKRFEAHTHHIHTRAHTHRHTHICMHKTCTHKCTTQTNTHTHALHTARGPSLHTCCACA